MYTLITTNVFVLICHFQKQEPEESCNNDSGISPSPYHSDGSVQNTSPQSQSGRSEDSGHGHEQTNATLGVLARPIMASSSPRQSPLSRLSPLHQQLSPLQRQLSPLQMSPREETQTNASLGVLARPVMGSPRQSPLSRLSPLQPAMVVCQLYCLSIFFIKTCGQFFIR